ncbi:MAG: ribosome maturation factor RimM [Paracoccaceae bacterium]
MNDLVVVGSIGGSFGVRGEVRIKSFCAVPTDIETYTPLTDENGHSYDLALIGPIKNGFAARIVQIKTKEQADALKGTQLFASRSQMPSLPDDEFYHADLMGLDVFDTGGTLLGQVKTVHNHGADDLLEVTRPGSSDTVLIPFTRAIVPTVDLNARRIVADPPEGLI